MLLVWRLSLHHKPGVTDHVRNQPDLTVAGLQGDCRRLHVCPLTE